MRAMFSIFAAQLLLIPTIIGVVPATAAHAAQSTMCGDLDGNGKVAASDALLLLKRAVGQQISISCPGCASPVSEAESSPAAYAQSLMCGDLDGNGKIAASDSLMLLRHAVGQDIPISCPVCAAAGCGNGVRDGAEACEGLDGCAAGQRCTAACTCATPATPPPTSQDLIAQALSRGDIDYPTSLLYRVWALFMAPELPAAYDGAGSSGEDTDLLIDLSHVRGTLPPDIESAITPYLVRPTDPVSVYSHVPAAAPAGLSPAQQAAAPPAINCPAVNNVPAWGSFETAHFVIWSCEIGRCRAGKPATTACQTDSDCDIFPGSEDGICTAATDLARRLTVGAVAEEVYAAFTPKLGAPRADDYAYGPEPRGRIDIYMLRPNECRLRDAFCLPISATAIAQAMPDKPCDRDGGGPLTSSGYAMINANQVPAAAPGPDEPSKFRADLDHELFHVYEFGLNVEVMGTVCDPTPLYDPNKGKTWLTEASAEWASFGFFPIDDVERRTTLFTQFQTQRASTTYGLQETGGMFPYQAALYLQFVQQESGSIQPLVDLWTESQAARTNEELDTHLNSLLSFSDHFRDFTVRDLNLDLAGTPIDPLFSEFDGARTKGIPPYILQPQWHLVANTTEDYGVYSLPLFAMFTTFSVDDGARYVRIDASAVQNAPHLSLDAIVKVGARWERRKVEGPIFEFCREDAGDDISEFYLVMTNDDRSTDGIVDGEYKVQAKPSCPGGWSGQIRSVMTHDKHSEETWVHGSQVIDLHERDEQSWTVVGTEAPYPGMDQLDTSWQATYSSNSVTTAWEQDCGKSVFTDSSNESGTAQSAFYAFPIGAGVFSLTPIALSHNFNAPIEYKFQKCDGSSGTSEGEELVVEGFAYLTAVQDLMNMTELPDDPGHFAGTANVIHSEQQTSGVGLEVIDITVSWDLRRKLAR